MKLAIKLAAVILGGSTDVMGQVLAQTIEE